MGGIRPSGLDITFQLITRGRKKSCLQAGNEMTMWPFRGLEVNRAPCDLSFMEAISQRMQVPNRLKMVDESSLLEEERKAEELPPSFQMHIPDRLSLAEMMEAGLRPLLLDQRQQHPSIVVHAPEDPSTLPAAFGELLFLNTTTQSGTQKRKRSAHPGRLRKERTRSENPQLALRGTGQKPDRPDTSPLSSPPFPPFTQDGRIYSLQNIFQMLCFLGHVLFHRVKKSAHVQAQPR
ncbi:mitochondrial fission factor-like isoform X2 [Emydura macquarii macquarii]|uniref:mitochondrial fission factor-like isoform X2 n=1 Tax=Emydura macquarii macquarii TaxID=1129001 RepID=UPI00352A47FE